MVFRFFFFFCCLAFCFCVLTWGCGWCLVIDVGWLTRALWSDGAVYAPTEPDSKNTPYLVCLVGAKSQTACSGNSRLCDEVYIQVYKSNQYAWTHNNLLSFSILVLRVGFTWKCSFSSTANGCARKSDNWGYVTASLSFTTGRRR